MIKHRWFVTPRSASDEGDGAQGGMDALNNLLDGMNAEGSGENTDGQQQQGQQQNTDANESGTQQQGQQQNNQQQGQRTQQDKQNFAFGQMRTQINQLTEMLGKVAKANGIEYTDSKDLVAKLNDDAINKMAAKQNVPVELLKEIEALRQDSAAYKQQRLKDAAAVGFQQIMDTYGLNQQQLEQFAIELDQAGVNPFIQPVDLMREYKNMHYDDILKAEVQKAVEAALKKDSAANQSSSNPGQQQGSAGSSDQKITTVAGLTELLNSAN